MITLLGVPFDFSGMTYYQTNKDIALGTPVVCTTDHGTFIGKVSKIRKPTDEEAKKPDFNRIFPPIDRIATFSDLSFLRDAEERAQEITKEAQAQATNLKLSMKVLKTYLDVDDDKALITFTSDGRVDFRELVRILSGEFHLHIELRQIGPRDQAKLVGGIGPCGLPLCCTTFLSSFDGISIAMAKNQLLAINIPKLSGQCGKLMCCLKFEDEAYAEIRPLYPKIGEKFTYNNKTYQVTGLNLLTDTITTYNGDSYESFTKEEYERVKKGLAKVDASTLETIKDVNAGVDLSGHGIKDTNNRIAQIKKSEARHMEDLKNKTAPHSSQPSRNNNFNHRGNGASSQQPRNNNNNGRPNPNNSNRSFHGSKNHSYGGNTHTNRNNNFHGSKGNFHNSTPVKKESGFIPVSQIADKSVLDVKPVKKDDQK